MNFSRAIDPNYFWISSSWIVSYFFFFCVPSHREFIRDIYICMMHISQFFGSSSFTPPQPSHIVPLVWPLVGIHEVWCMIGFIPPYIPVRLYITFSPFPFPFFRFLDLLTLGGVGSENGLWSSLFCAFRCFLRFTLDDSFFFSPCSSFLYVSLPSDCDLNGREIPCTANVEVVCLRQLVHDIIHGTWRARYARPI